MTHVPASTSSSVLLPTDPAPPAPILTTETAVAQWPTTPGFKAFWGWIKHRCERIKGRDILTGDYDSSSTGIKTWMKLLNDMKDWVEEVPPEPQSAQRFGNLAFRKYIALVEQRLPAYFSDSIIPDQLRSQLIPLLINSNAFGHQTRLDYGTGHELAFMLGLWCCVVSGWIRGEEDEDELILRVFANYLELVTLLQQTYRLEPAGSHGVWGLDDYCFFPYLFGSAQLLDSSLTPAQSLQLATSPTSTSTSTITTSASIPERREDAIKDFYTLSLHRITLFKRGAAFSEHSPLLYQLSQMPNWVKPHNGLRKMFMGEVVGKRVVVQGLWIGGWCWGDDMPIVMPRAGARIAERGSSGRDNNVSGTSGSVGSRGVEVTKAPWAK